MTDLRQSKSYATYMKNLGWQVEKVNNIYCYLKKFPLLGYFAKIQRPTEISSTLINKIEAQFHPFQIIIEPVSINSIPVLKKAKFNLSKSPYSPTQSLLLNLTPSTYSLYHSLEKETRRLLRKTQNQEISETKNVPLFHRAFNSAVNRSRYVPSIINLTSLQNAFGDKSLFLLTQNHTAGAVFLRTKRTGYYWLAFTSKEGRRNKSQYQILWQGLEWAKNEGCEAFDFEGIYDTRFPIKSWKGFTHFKKGFGGIEVKYPGTFSKFSWKNLLK